MRMSHSPDTSANVRMRLCGSTGSDPAGPAIGKNVVPGMTKAPQPIMQPKAIAHTSSGDRYLAITLAPFPVGFMREAI